VRLPGVGWVDSVVTAGGCRLAVVVRDGAASEVHMFAGAQDAEPLAAVRLEAREARWLAAALGPDDEPPPIVEDLEVLLGELAITRAQVAEGSSAVGRSLAQCDVAGVAVVAILREPEPVVAPGPAEILAAGDTLVAIGRVEDHRALRELLGDGP
jgi:K+/H+ antiporter YhaU regulatory subunit KhtT